MIFFGENYYGGIGHEGAKARRNTKDWCGGIGHEFTNVRVIFGEGLVRRLATNSRMGG